MKAIPTKYAHTRFRSRLEARYAAFFDLLKWDWHYEAFDLDGYIPDFIIGNNQDVILEVKKGTDDDELEAFQKKLRRSGWKRDAVLAGPIPIPATNQEGLSFGLHGGSCGATDPEDDRIEWDFDEFIIGNCAKTNGRVPTKWEIDNNCTTAKCIGRSDFGFSHQTGSFHCRICRAYDGNPVQYDPEVEILWREAGNEVQWYKV